VKSPKHAADPTDRSGRRPVQRIGFVAGPLLAAFAWLALPDAYVASGGEHVALEPAARATCAVAVWMATWWLSEAVEIYVTALLPLVLLPLLGATSMQAAAAPYAHHLIFLFMGGFLIGLSMQRWGLHRRIALGALRLAGDRPARIVGAFMAVTAFLSMWVSNTATAVMMLPVATSVIELVDTSAKDDAPSTRSFALCLLLGIAYSASIGGIGTPIGTPPNLFLASFMKANLGREVSFVRWMLLALPLLAVFLPLTWLLLTHVLHPIRMRRIEGASELVRRAHDALGPPSTGEKITLAVFTAAAALWMTRPLLASLEIGGAKPLAGLSDAGIAMLAALVLFVSPVSRRKGAFVLDWDTAVKLPWGILILFGGGLSLAAAIESVGLGEFFGAQVGALAGTPSWIVVLVVVTGIVFLTELTSNTATTATLIPILAALAPGLGIDPVLLIVPAAIAASCAFMLPVATPPNAIIFGSGRVTIPQMSRVGFWLNWIAVGLITGLTYSVIAPMLVRG
jgi:sodium-dependent dicarboxylate transporter 2/3/5